MTDVLPQTPRTILLVEDHEQLRNILTKALTTFGYCVLPADTGDEALRQLVAGAVPDLLFTDIRMPGKTNGLELARWVDSHRPGCRVLLQTGFTDVDTGEWPVLNKPYTDEELLRAIANALT